MKESDKSKYSELMYFSSDLKPFLNTPFKTNWLTLLLCEEGYGKLSLNFKLFAVHKGDIVIVPEGMSLIPLQTSSLFKAEIIRVEAQHCEDMEYNISDIAYWDFLYENPILHTDSCQYEMLCNWFAQMKWIMDDKDYDFYDDAVSNCIYTLFIMIYKNLKHIIKQSDNKTKRGRAHKIFSDFTNYIIRYHTKHRDVNFYANLLSITPEYLNKIAKAHWDITAKEQIDWQVVMAIKNYLTCTDLSIKNIAEQLNYNDPSYMCRFFKKMTGMSPIQFRNKEITKTQNLRI